MCSHGGRPAFVRRGRESSQKIGLRKFLLSYCRIFHSRRPRFSSFDGSNSRARAACSSNGSYLGVVWAFGVFIGLKRPRDLLNPAPIADRVGLDEALRTVVAGKVHASEII